jgi:hypothetical protein
MPSALDVREMKRSGRRVKHVPILLGKIIRREKTGKKRGQVQCTYEDQHRGNFLT